MRTRTVHRDFLKSQSITKKRRKKRIVKYSIIFFAVLALILCASWITKLERTSINTIVVVGNIDVTSAEIESVVRGQIDSSYVSLFSKSSSFLVPKHDIAELIRTTFPRIEQVDVDVESFHILNVKIKEREAVAIWCAAIKCYLVDSTGYIFSEYIEPTEQTIVVGDTSELPRLFGMDELVGSVPVGNRVYTERLFNDILRALNEIETIGYKVERVTVRSRDEIVFDIEHNGNILFSDRKPFDVSLDNFKASLHSNALSSSTQFEYIDVRFGNKVFYKIDMSRASTSQNTVHASSSKKR